MYARVGSFIGVFVLATSAFAQADNTKAFWVKKYADIGNMFAKKDMDTFVATLDPAFTMIDKSGKSYTRAQFIQMECDPIRSATKVTDTVRVMSVKFKGDTVLVGYDWQYTILMPGAKDMGREVGTDTWHKVNGKWLTIKTTVKFSSDMTAKTRS